MIYDGAGLVKYAAFSASREAVKIIGLRALEQLRTFLSRPLASQSGIEESNFVDNPAVYRHVSAVGIAASSVKPLRFITEILGIDVLYPEGRMIDPHAEEFPENWYQEVKK